MKAPKDKQAQAEIAQILAHLLGVAPEEIRAGMTLGEGSFDSVIELPKVRFLVEYRVSASSGPLAAAIEQLKQASESHADSDIPLIVVPFMGNVGRELCEKAGVCWLDLSGNAKIASDNLRIWIEGRPNRYSGPGRPPNIFAPKGSRIVREMLLNPKRFHSQSELAKRTNLDDGYVSKIVRRLKSEDIVVVNEEGEVRPQHPTSLLDAWWAAHDFSRNRILKGHIEARSGDALIARIAEQLEHQDVPYGITGLAAAWLWTRFAAFRIGTVYLREHPPNSLLDSIGFWNEERGANVWIVLPKDEGVFQGGEIVENIRCVSPVQAYIDLKDHPERAKEAAQSLRENRLEWSLDGT